MIGQGSSRNFIWSIVAAQVLVQIGAFTLPALLGPVAELVGIRVGVVSGVMNLESSGVEASDWRPRHDQGYHQV